MKTSWKVFVPFGALVALIGILSASLSAVILDAILNGNLLLSPKSQTYPLWKDMTNMLQADFYFFNMTNMEDVRDHGAKPALSQIGPYSFFEQHHKFDVVWNDNGTVTYKQRKVWTHISGDLEDLVTVINIPFASVGDQVSKLPDIEAVLAAAAIATALPSEKLFVTVKVSEFLFEGYDDPLLGAASKLEAVGIKIPGVTSKFGFFYGRNDSWFADGVTNIHTGSDGIENLGRIGAVNYTDHSQFFEGSCGQYNGSVDFFPPYLGTRHKEYAFNVDLCRTLELTSTGETEKFYGTSGNVYVQDANLFANSTVNPDNKCFENEEIPSGLFDVSACRFNAPIYMSQPHFYQADPYYASLLQEGSVDPKENEHETKFVFEPVSGVPLSVHVRFQVNVKMSQIKAISKFKHLPAGKVYMPVMWADYHLDLQQDFASKLWYLGNLQVIVIAVGGLMIGTGILLLVLGFLKYKTTLQEQPNPSYGRVEIVEDNIDEVNKNNDPVTEDEIIQ